MGHELTFFKLLLLSCLLLFLLWIVFLLSYEFYYDMMMPKDDGIPDTTPLFYFCVPIAYVSLWL